MEKNSVIQFSEYRLELNDCYHPVLMEEKKLNIKSTVNQPEQLVEFLNNNFHMDRLANETVYFVSLNTKGRPVGLFKASCGTSRCSLVDPGDLAKLLLLTGGCSGVMIHNHPSGVPFPSNEDWGICYKIHAAFNLLNLNFLDSIIIGRNEHFSMAAEPEWEKAKFKNQLMVS